MLKNPGMLMLATSAHGEFLLDIAEANIAKSHASCRVTGLLLTSRYVTATDNQEDKMVP